jgi:hypothetical protein
MKLISDNYQPQYTRDKGKYKASLSAEMMFEAVTPARIAVSVLSLERDGIMTGDDTQ